ncbi:Annexin [Rhynchospora pubera]|uniref:Annexin n=1 Tax=Rhynchospora pubera TaxID=906938 RepID=A0AAV8DQW8_9POAL|nr:Annexin [Rhynchospora pubera]KAJ4782672.1 Annexin [Rhynchospora pubera]KAJ4789569.1 Annexin [Rhynchospora pubera]
MASITVPSEPPPPRQDCKDLRRAFGDRDKPAIIKILAHRDGSQRALIQQEYRAMYCMDLSAQIESDLWGHLKEGLLLWLPDPTTRDVNLLRDALTPATTTIIMDQPPDATTDEQPDETTDEPADPKSDQPETITRTRIDEATVIEIICSRDSSEIQAIRQAYDSEEGTTPLDETITQWFAGDCQMLLLSCIGDKLEYDEPEVDPELVEIDVEELYRAGEKRLGTDEDIFIRIFTQRSWPHLAAVYDSYKKTYDKSLDKVVDSETTGSFRFGLQTILNCAVNRPKYYAKGLRQSMKGLGTDDTTLIFIVVTRAEIDMEHIKAEYKKKYHKKLEKAIHSDTSGNYRLFLEALVGHTD